MQDQKAYVAVKCLVDVEALLRVKGSHARCESGKISETVQAV